MRFLFFVFFALIGALPSIASDTPWINHGGMLKTRLIAASSAYQTGEGVLLAWEAKLEPGWKTYWRSPGEAGLPVRIFVGGEEVAPMYPLPSRFDLFGIQTYGYSHQLLLPFRAAAGPHDLTAIKVDFMVCKDICVPFEYSYALQPFAAEASIHDIRFEAWLKKVPVKTGDGDAGLKIIAAKVAGKIGHQKLIVDVSADTDLSKMDMLAEVNDMFHFAAPQIRLLENGKKARLVLTAMTGNMPEELRGKSVRLTFSNGRGAAIDRILELAK